MRDNISGDAPDTSPSIGGVERGPIPSSLFAPASRRTVRVGTMFSGIGAPETAWAQLGWDFRWCAEIEAFPSAVLAHRFPHVRNLGDVTKVDWDAVEPIDLLCFGSPCQSFSVAGKRLGLDDPRGNLALFALGVARRLRPEWLVFENVPGLLSSDGTGDFGAFLGLLGECGYGFAYRVLDAQHFGVPQRRRRVFVVGHLGDWRDPTAVLFESESLSGHPAPRREEGERVARPIAAGSRLGSGYRNDADTADNLIARSLNAHPSRSDGESETFIAHPLRAQSQPSHRADSDTYVAATLNGNSGRLQVESTYLAHSLRADGFDASENGTGRGTPLVTVGTLLGNGDAHSGFKDEFGLTVDSAAVRRLTPRECERLQGFPDDFTAVTYRGKPAADGPRYKALGNSMAVPVIRWIGSRIKQVDTLKRSDLAVIPPDGRLQASSEIAAASLAGRSGGVVDHQQNVLRVPHDHDSGRGTDTCERASVTP